MSNLLSKSELKALTGAAESEWAEILRRNGIPYVRRKDGLPAVTWEMVNQSQLAKPSRQAIPAGMNLEAI